MAIGGLVCAVLHASFDPHASVFPQPVLAAGAGGCGFGACVGWERLNTDDGAIVGEATVCFGGALGAVEEKSNKSVIPELVFAAFVKGAGDMPGAESKAPNPLEELNPRDGCGGAGADFCTGFASKKLPPLKGGDDTEDPDLWPETLPSPANADGLGCA